MGIRCIALDLDGTVLNSKKELTQKVREALESAAEKGVVLVLASGRPFSSFPRQMDGLKGVRYRVTGNGTGIYDAEGKALRRVRLSGKAVEKLLEVTADENIRIEAVVEGKPYADEVYVADPQRFGVSAGGAVYVQATRQPVADMEAFVRACRNELDCVNLILQPDAKEAAAEKIRKEIPEVYVTSSSKIMLEISDGRCGKAAALAWILEREGIASSDCAAFGDGENDVQMLKSCGFGIAMGNAEEICKKAAVYVTDDHNRDGVAEGIDWLRKNVGFERRKK